MMAVVFPFEEAFYVKHQVPVEFVGHPLVDEVRASADKTTLQHEFNLQPKLRTIGLFPGSRRSEIKRLLPTILESARLLKKSHPDVQFIMPLADSLGLDDLHACLGKYQELEIQVVQHRPYDVMAVCDLILTVSGTVTLEIALMGTPLVIINRVANLTYFLVKRMLKIKHIGLCNIVAGKRVAPEHIQFDATPQHIERTMARLLDDPEAMQQMRDELAKIEDKLGAAGGIGKMRDLTLRMLDTN